MPAETLDELVAQFDRAIEQLPTLILKHTEQGALGALALVDLRITEKGIDASGGRFSPYTPEYQKRKTKLGRYRGFVDFQLTGQMLASTTTGFERIAPTERSISKGTARITFDGRDDLTRKKLRGNDAKRPNFLQPSKEEMKMVTKSANEGLGRDLETIFR